MHTYACSHMHTFMSAYVAMGMCTYVSMHMCASVSIHMCASECDRVCVHVSLCICAILGCEYPHLLMWLIEIFQVRLGLGSTSPSEAPHRDDALRTEPVTSCRQDTAFTWEAGHPGCSWLFFEGLDRRNGNEICAWDLLLSLNLSHPSGEEGDSYSTLKKTRIPRAVALHASGLIQFPASVPYGPLSFAGVIPEYKGRNNPKNFWVWLPNSIK